MQRLFRLVLVSIALLLAACATNSPTCPNQAIIRGSTVHCEVGMGSYGDSFEIREVEGGFAGFSMFGSKVAPGQRFFLVEHRGYRSGRPMGEEVTAGKLRLMAYLQAGHRYEVTGEGTETTARAWIRDLQTGVAVSGVVEGTLRTDH
jgi:hypothetical protein